MINPGQWVIVPQGRKAVVVREKNDTVTCEWPEDGKLQSETFRLSAVRALTSFQRLHKRSPHGPVLKMAEGLEKRNENAETAAREEIPPLTPERFRSSPQFRRFKKGCAGS
jgi:hypothetical protein